MIKSKEDYLYYLEADKISLGIKRKRVPLISIYESDVIWKFQRLLRKNEYYHNCKKSGIFYIYYKWIQYKLFRMQLKTGFSVPINVFGPGFSISHMGPIVINGFAKAGKNCRIHPMTCIGIDGSSPKVAEIGDDVYISVGTKIIGGVKIADGVTLASGSVVVKSINEPSTTWGGVPARKISDSGSPFPNDRKGAYIAKRSK